VEGGAHANPQTGSPGDDQEAVSGTSGDRRGAGAAPPRWRIAVLLATPVLFALAGCQPDAATAPHLPVPASAAGTPVDLPGVVIRPAGPAEQVIAAAASTTTTPAAAPSAKASSPAGSPTATILPCPNGLGLAYHVPMTVTAARGQAVVTWWAPQPVSGIAAFLLAAVPEQAAVTGVSPRPLQWRRYPVGAGCHLMQATVTGLTSKQVYDFWLQAEALDVESLTGAYVTRVVGRSGPTPIP